MDTAFFKLRPNSLSLGMIVETIALCQGPTAQGELPGVSRRKPDLPPLFPHDPFLRVGDNPTARGLRYPYAVGRNLTS
jgi:hypothetical protein